MLLFIASKLYFFFLPTLAFPQRLGQAAVSSHMPACALCSEFTLPRSKELQRFELQPGLKDNAVTVACDFEILKSFSDSKRSTDETGKQALFLSVFSFWFSVYIKRGSWLYLHLFSISCFGGGLQRCKPCGVAHVSQKDICAVRHWEQWQQKKAKMWTYFPKQPQFVFTIHTLIVLIWYQIFCV